MRTTTSNGVKRRYRSGLEEAIAHQIESANLPVIYEETTLDYIWPARPSRYTPDFQMGDIHLEVKGLFDVQARHKMLLVKQQHPDLDIRFVFSNANAPIYKGSPTTTHSGATSTASPGRTAGYQTNGYAPLNKKEKPMLKKRSQEPTTQVLDALMMGDRITAMSALARFNCARLAARIFDLRKQGYDIVTGAHHTQRQDVR